MRNWTFALATAAVLSQGATAAPYDERSVSVCSIAGKLMSGCDQTTSMPRKGAVVLSFDVEAESDRRGSLADASTKTNDAVTVAKAEPRRQRLESQESDWCKALSK